MDWGVFWFGMIFLLYPDSMFFFKSSPYIGLPVTEMAAWTRFMELNLWKCRKRPSSRWGIATWCLRAASHSRSGCWYIARSFLSISGQSWRTDLGTTLKGFYMQFRGATKKKANSIYTGRGASILCTTTRQVVRMPRHFRSLTTTTGCPLLLFTIPCVVQTLDGKKKSPMQMHWKSPREDVLASIMLTHQKFENPSRPWQGCTLP